MTYGAFPIFTRRYAFHGVENFAFDLLLGKPCLIVAHHDSFKDDGTALWSNHGDSGPSTATFAGARLGRLSAWRAVARTAVRAWKR